MKIKLTSVIVEDQAKALKFYTEVLGFVKKREIPMGAFKWLTVISPEGSGEIELALEPNAFPAAKAYQEALFKAGIPLAAFAADDVQKEYERLRKLGVVFRQGPKKAAGPTTAVFEDNCGNLIQIFQA